MGSKAFGKKTAAKPHLVVGPGGLGAEILDVRRDIEEAFTTVETALSPYLFEAGPIPCEVTDIDGIKLQIASVAAPVTYANTDFDGVLGVTRTPAKVAVIRAPRKVTLTVEAGGTPAHWLGGTVHLIGTDVDGNVQSEDMTSAAGAGTTTSVKYYDTLVSIALPAASNTGALIDVGVVADTASVASLVSALAAQVFDTNAGFNRTRVGNRAMPVARSIDIVLNNNADWDVGAIVLYGFDAQGLAISESYAVPNGGNTTLVGTKFFSQVTKYTCTAMSGTGGTAAIGFATTTVGLPRAILGGAIADVGIRELARTDENDTTWAIPTAGVVTSPATDPPYGSLTPNTAPNGVVENIFCYLAVGK